MRLDDAKTVKVGETDAVAVYQGTEQVWNAVPAYAAAVLEDSPLVYLRLQETVPDNGAYDFTGNGLDAEYIGDIILGEDGPIASDPDSKAVRTFGNPTDPRVRWSDAYLWMPSGAYTFEHWVHKENSRSEASWSYGASNYFLAYMDYTSTGVFHSSATQMAHNRNIGNTWVHHVITRADDDTLKLYLDGVLQDTKTKSAINIGGTGFLVLGQEQDSNDGGYQENQAFSGMIAEPAVYDYDLSAERILAHYNAAAA